MDSLPYSTILYKRERSGEVRTRSSISYYDGHGNVVQTRAQLSDGRFQVTGWQERNLRNLLVRQHVDFTSAEQAFNRDEALNAPVSQRLTYDAVGRVVNASDRAGFASRAMYTSDGLVFFDAQDTNPDSAFANTPRSQTIDPLGRVTSVTEDLKGELMKTSYTYDASAG